MTGMEFIPNKKIVRFRTEGEPEFVLNIAYFQKALRPKAEISINADSVKKEVDEIIKKVKKDIEADFKERIEDFKKDIKAIEVKIKKTKDKSKKKDLEVDIAIAEKSIERIKKTRDERLEAHGSTEMFNKFLDRARNQAVEKKLMEIVDNEFKNYLYEAQNATDNLYELAQNIGK